ncbi:MAG: DUF4863 family protein [Myxococcota bacterium]
MPSLDEVRAALAPFARAIAALDLTDAAAVQARLNREHPVEALGAVRALLVDANAAGILTPRRASDGLTFGRVGKPSEELGGCSIDAVDMTGAGAPHTHPNGEVSLCFAVAGDPRFVGFPEGWVAVPPGSRHVPEVTGGRMVIVYFLPGGAMVWD